MVEGHSDQQQELRGKGAPAAVTQLVHAFFHALNQRDMERLEPQYHADAQTFIDLSGVLMLRGTFAKADTMEIILALWELFPDGLRYEIDAIDLLQDDGSCIRASVSVRSAGTHASGRVYLNRHRFMIEFRDRQIISIWSTKDVELAHQVLFGMTL